MLNKEVNILHNPEEFFNMLTDEEFFNLLDEYNILYERIICEGDL